MPTSKTPAGILYFGLGKPKSPKGHPSRDASRRLEEDLQKNLDAQKLRNFGSKIADTFAPDYCPTCSQPIQDTLLAQQASAAVMRVEDNIEYIRSQRTIFQRLSAQEAAAILNIDRKLAAATMRSTKPTLG